MEDLSGLLRLELGQRQGHGMNSTADSVPGAAKQGAWMRGHLILRSLRHPSHEQFLCLTALRLGSESSLPAPISSYAYPAVGLG